MYRDLLSAPHIGSYPAFLLFGLIAGYLLLRWRAVRLGIRGSHIDNLAILIAVTSLFGARFFSWLFYFPPGIGLGDALTSVSGGMVFYGGVFFGIAGVILYSWGARLPIATLLDASAPALALGLAVGRVGCYLAGCCWGDLCVNSAGLTNVPDGQTLRQVRTFPVLSEPSFPLAVTFPREAGAYQQHRELALLDAEAVRSLPVHPVQLYEAALALLLSAGLHRRFHHRRWPGQVACWFALGYAGIRFLTEFLRADNAATYWGLTLSQVISVALAALAVSAVLWHRKPEPISAAHAPSGASTPARSSIQ